MKRNYFDPETVYVDSDKELDLIANRDKRAQWRHKRVGPSFIKMGRKVGYLGEDLIATFFCRDSKCSNDPSVLQAD